jgi:hypothetical protein
MTEKKRTVGGLNTRTVRTRVTLSIPVDIDDVAFSGRVTNEIAERLAIDFLLDNPQILRDNLRVTLRLQNRKDGTP